MIHWKWCNVALFRFVVFFVVVVFTRNVCLLIDTTLCQQFKQLSGNIMCIMNEYDMHSNKQSYVMFQLKNKIIRVEWQKETTTTIATTMITTATLTTKIVFCWTCEIDYGSSYYTINALCTLVPNHYTQLKNWCFQNRRKIWIYFSNFGLNDSWINKSPYIVILLMFCPKSIQKWIFVLFKRFIRLISHSIVVALVCVCMDDFLYAVKLIIWNP